MNFLERLAYKPLFAVAKRSDAASADSAEFLPLEDLRLQMIDVWSQKGPTSKVPAWLDSAESLRAHFEHMFSPLQDQLQSGEEAAGDVLTLKSLPGEAEPLAAIFETPGVFEEPGSVISDILPPASPFAPELGDIPFAIG